MKLIITAFFFPALMQVGCTENNASADTSMGTTPTTATSKDAKERNGDGIVGEWELVGSIVDTNDNLQLDEEEKKESETGSL